MAAPTTLFFTDFLLVSLVLSGWRGAEGSGHHQRNNVVRVFGFRPAKLFVLGNSYVDTGNSRISMSSAWKKPYGLSFPGKPAGRFSDGRILTDNFARWVGLKTPIPHQFGNIGNGQKVLRSGVNFAFGGTGVFDTKIKGPNLTAQIDQFQQLLQDRVISPADIRSSIVLVNDGGNDYRGFISRNPSLKGREVFIRDIVSQMVVDLRRIHSLGVRKIVLGDLPPIGCLPAYLSNRRCNEKLNSFALHHISFLRQAVAKLNNETKDSSFIILRLYDAMMTVIKNKGARAGSSMFENPLVQCCVGINSHYNCGDEDKKGQLKYTVCSNPRTALFWDSLHPTAAGWRAITTVLQSSLIHGS